MARVPKKYLSCSTPAVPTTDAEGPFRPIPKCDPPLVPPSPDYTLAQAEAGEAAVLGLPLPMVFLSPEVTVSCDRWPAWETGSAPVGDPVTVAAGRYTASLYIQNLGLPRDDVYFIAEVFATQLSAAQALAVAGQTEELAALLSISQISAQTIIDSVAAIQLDLFDQADALAVSLLECLWANEPRVANCPDGAVIGSGYNNPSVILAGLYFSKYSQADANDQAAAAAELALECVYANDAQTVVCSDVDPLLYQLDPGNTLQTLGQSPGIDASQVFVNTSAVDAGWTFSSVSTEDANLQAREYLLTLLSCFYILPDPTPAVCDLDGDGYPADATVEPTVYDGVSVGNPVVVSANYVYSFDSMADALLQAQALAVSSLYCRWSNCQMTYSCEDSLADPSLADQVAAHCSTLASPSVYDDPYDLANKVGVEVYVGAFDKTIELFAIPAKSGDGYTYTVDAGDFPSEIGYLDANTSAANFALSQLLCIYCNPEIESSCPPLSITYTIKVEGVSYFVDGNVLLGVDTRPTIDIFGPEGDGAFTFCGADPQTVVFQADEIGKVAFKDLITLDTPCEFSNDETYAACNPANLVAAPDTWDWINPQTGAVEPRATQKVAATLPYDTPDHLSPKSTPGWVKVESGTFTASSQAEANSLAVAFALAQLDCFFENIPVTETCVPGGPVVSPLLTGTYSIPGGMYTSYISQADATTQAHTAALSMLVCMFCSREVKHTTCPIITLPECTCFSSISEDDATLTAEALLAAILAARPPCPDEWWNPGGGGGGGSGSSGSSGAASSGSDKSTAIVPASWQETGYAALFTHEMPEVRFDDIIRVPIRGAITRSLIDTRYLEVCDPGTVVVDSAVGDTGPVICARVEGPTLVVEVAAVGRRPETVTIRLTGFRRGFSGLRFPSRTAVQFEANEIFINSAYPK